MPALMKHRTEQLASERVINALAEHPEFGHLWASQRTPNGIAIKKTSQELQKPKHQAITPLQALTSILYKTNIGGPGGQEAAYYCYDDDDDDDGTEHWPSTPPEPEVQEAEVQEARSPTINKITTMVYAACASLCAIGAFSITINSPPDLTPEQLRQAEQNARNWVKKHQQEAGRRNPQTPLSAACSSDAALISKETSCLVLETIVTDPHSRTFTTKEHNLLCTPDTNTPNTCQPKNSHQP